MSLATYRELRPAYGFDEVAIVPGNFTVNPELTDIQFSIGEHAFNFPILAAALDAVVDTQFAIELGRRGGLAVHEPRGAPVPLRGPGGGDRRNRGSFAGGIGLGDPAAHRGADPRRVDRPAGAGDQGRRRRVRRLLHAGQHQEACADRSGRRSGHLRRAVDSHDSSARIDVPSWADPGGVDREHSRAGRGREYRRLPGVRKS